MEAFLNILIMSVKVLLVGFVLIYATHTAYFHRSRIFSFNREIWQQVNRELVVESMGVFALLVTAITLVQLHLPFLWWGWMHLFFKKGGSFLITPVVELRHSSHLAIRLIVPFFFLLLLLLLPFWAHVEEVVFRKGYHSWKEIRWQSLKFGLIHLMMGIPLIACFFLAGLGFFWACKYRTAYYRALRKMSKKWKTSREKAENKAVLTSTAYHAFFNGMGIVIIVVLTTIKAFAPT